MRDLTAMGKIKKRSQRMMRRLRRLETVENYLIAGRLQDASELLKQINPQWVCTLSNLNDLSAAIAKSIASLQATVEGLKDENLAARLESTKQQVSEDPKGYKKGRHSIWTVGSGHVKKTGN